MDIEKYEKAVSMAEQISFAFEDQFDDTDKKKMFIALFNRYLFPVDPAGEMDHYDAIIALWRKNPAEFDQMIGEFKKAALIPE